MERECGALCAYLSIFTVIQTYTCFILEWLKSELRTNQEDSCRLESLLPSRRQRNTFKKFKQLLRLTLTHHALDIMTAIVIDFILKHIHQRGHHIAIWLTGFLLAETIIRFKSVSRFS